MVCIAAFIVFAIIGIFSLKYRQLAKKAWYCTAKRLTFRPCDSSFKDDVKASILSKVLIKHPKMIKKADIAIEITAAIIVILTFWSLLVLVRSGLDLFVYGTCDPHEAQSCVLDTTKSCTINSPSLSFVESVKELKVHTWIYNWFSDFGTSIAAIPDKIKNWNANDYLPSNPSYSKYSKGKPTALLIFDPGCRICQEDYIKLEKANFFSSHNLAYIAYSIKIVGKNTYEFKNSNLIVSYLEAVKLKKMKTSNQPVDWRIINRLFTLRSPDGLLWQNEFNDVLSEQDAKNTVISWLKEFGYSPSEIDQINQLAESNEVKSTIENNRNIVTDKIKTINIPSMIFNGQLHVGLLEYNSLLN